MWVAFVGATVAAQPPSWLPRPSHTTHRQNGCTGLLGLVESVVSAVATAKGKNAGNLGFFAIMVEARPTTRVAGGGPPIHGDYHGERVLDLTGVAGLGGWGMVAARSCG